MPKMKSPTTLYCLRSRSGISETADVWKMTMRLKGHFPLGGIFHAE